MTAGASGNVTLPPMSPIALRDGFGLLHRGGGLPNCGVVLCSPWGIEELSGRKVLFRLATRLADAGMPTLRFDYPGTADAIGRPVGGFGAWIDAAADAADRLRAACGLDRIVFAGIGIGAAVALIASASRQDVGALVLAAPVISGRRHLREIALGAPVVDESLGLDASQRPAGVSIGGIVMAPAVAAELRSLDLLKVDPGSRKPVLLVERPSQPQDTMLADHLTGEGWAIDRLAFEGYDAAMDNPTIAVMPEGVLDAIAKWIGDAVPVSIGGAVETVPPAPAPVERQQGADEALTFGPGLFGVMAHPQARRAAPAVVFLNSGYDHHAGWAYQWARAARTLADEGIPSLRFDMANIGDSAAKPGATEQVLYGEGQQADIASAIDLLAARGESSVVLVGRCSGAFAAFHAAAGDERISAVVAVNPLRLIWDADEDVDVAIRVGPRSMADYRRRVLSRHMFGRLLAGDINVAGAFKGLGTQLIRRIARLAAPALGSRSKTVGLRRQCHAMMGAISRRGAALQFVCSERDASLEQMTFYFGGNYSGLGRFAGASLTTVPNADHNMTPQAAHDIVVEAIRKAVLGVSTRSVLQPQSATTDTAQLAGPAEQVRI